MFGKKVLQSSGSFPGANAQMTYFPDDELAVVVLSNSYAPVAGTIARDVDDSYFNPFDWATIVFRSGEAGRW